jgi:cyclophilin family peptidyl-prolyl cis-trans isomerase
MIPLPWVRKFITRTETISRTRQLGFEMVEPRLMLSATTVGDEVLVNDLTVHAQSINESSSAVVTTPNNTIVVFEGNGRGDRQGVYAEILDTNGQTTVASFLVNSKIRGRQQAPAVAADADGNFVVTWAGRGAGDKRGIFFQRFDAAGTALGDETLVNVTTGGAQQEPAVAMAADGSMVVAWSGVGTADVAGIFIRRFDSNGLPLSSEILVNTHTDDYQVEPAVTFDSAGNLIVAWSSRHQDGSDWGLFAQRFNSAGDRLGTEFAINTTTIQSQSAVALAGNPTGGFYAVWNSFGQDGDRWGVVGQRFTVDGTTIGTEIVLNDSTTGHQRDPSLSVDASGRVLAAWTHGTDNGSGWEVTARSLAADGSFDGASFSAHSETAGLNSGHQRNPSVSASGNSAVITWSGNGLLDHQGVILQRFDTGDDEPVPPQAPNLVGFAQALADSGTQFFGAAWCPACTAQKEAFEDGAQFLPFVEVTNPDRSINQIGLDNNITVFPTWIFPNGSRLEGQQTLQTISDRSGVAIPTSDDPFLAELVDETLLVGSPLHLSLDGYDPNGDPLAYSVTSDNPDVTATILAGNRSARINVAGYGDLVFELFEQRAARATERMIELADDDFYRDIIFHRVIDGFVIQGGDPTGTGSGGSTLGDFDDQFHPDLQHNRTGLLSMAKSTDDTNDSQFFITEGATRDLDFNHTIFGVLVEGESNREAISNTAVTGPANSPRPINDVVMEEIDIFSDDENGVLLLKATDGATGSANITVTATDQQGRTMQRTFRVDLAADTSNGNPYLNDIGPVSSPIDTPAQIQLTATDVEDDSVFFEASPRGTVNYTFTLSPTGLLEVTPLAGFTGTAEILVSVGRATNVLDDNQLLTIEFG